MVVDPPNFWGKVQTGIRPQPRPTVPPMGSRPVPSCDLPASDSALRQSRAFGAASHNVPSRNGVACNVYRYSREIWHRL